MMVIVEGPDGSGKSTLCNELSKHGYTILRRVITDKNFTVLEVLNLALSNDKFVIDRALLTPWAYRLLDKKPLNDDDFTFSQIQFLLKYCTVIYCNTDKCFEYSMTRGEDNITSESKATELRKNYDFIINTLKLFNLCKVFEYDFTINTVEDVLKFLQ